MPGAAAPVHDALGLLEISSIARGYRVVDALVKKSPVLLLEANVVEPGKFLVLFSGSVAEVEESFKEAMEVAGDACIDHLFLPFQGLSILGWTQSPTFWGRQPPTGVPLQLPLWWTRCRAHGLKQCSKKSLCRAATW